MIIVRVDKATRDFTRAFNKLSKQAIQTATSNAINKTLLKGRTVARTAVKKVYNIPQKNLTGIAIKRSKPSFLQGAITASTKPIPMDAFSPRFQVVSAGGSASSVTISRRGLLKVRDIKRANNKLGVSIEVKKGDRTTVPYAFLIPTAKPRVFARGEYKPGNGSYGFIQRHTRLNNESGNDSVKPLVSVTVFGAVINPVVKGNIARLVKEDYSKNLISALRYQASLMS